MAIRAVLDIKGWEASPYLGTDTTFEVPYIVQTDFVTQGAQAIKDSGCLPQRGDVFSENIYCAAFSCRLKRDPLQPLIWRASITFKTDSLSPQEKDKELFPNPIDRPVDIEWDSVGYSKIATETVEDYTPPDGTLMKCGTPVLNSALDKFDPPLEITDYRWTATITKNVESVPAWIMEMPGRVNKDPFTIDGIYREAMSARIVGIRIGKRARDNGSNYRELRLTIEFREKRESRYFGDPVPEPYIVEIQDEGYKFNDVAGDYGVSGASGRIRLPYYKSSEINVTTTDPLAPVPVMLNGAGIPLVNPGFDNESLLPFCVYRTADFSVLPLAA